MLLTPCSTLKASVCSRVRRGRSSISKPRRRRRKRAFRPEGQRWVSVAMRYSTAFLDVVRLPADATSRMVSCSIALSVGRALSHAISPADETVGATAEAVTGAAADSGTTFVFMCGIISGSDRRRMLGLPPAGRSSPRCATPVPASDREAPSVAVGEVQPEPSWIVSPMRIPTMSASPEVDTFDASVLSCGHRSSTTGSPATTMRGSRSISPSASASSPTSARATRWC